MSEKKKKEYHIGEIHPEMPERDMQKYNEGVANLIKIAKSNNMTQDSIEQRVKELLDDPRTGLRPSSNTNKTRYAILAALDDTRTETARDIARWIDKRATEEHKKKDWLETDEILSHISTTFTHDDNYTKNE